jgi:D-alanyl-D-alanine carboxypeptidase
MRRLLAILLLLTVTACAGHRPAPVTSYGQRPSYAPDLPRGWSGACNEPANARQAADNNARSVDSLPVAPFGHTEIGWRVYAPLTARETGTLCLPDTAGFAEALARWKVAHRMAYDGTMDDATLAVLKGAWQEHRPFLMSRVRHEPCPEPPDAESLAQIQPRESHYGKPILIRPEVLGAYRQMAGDARRAIPELAADPMLLTIFSGYRSPEYDAASCANQGGCNGVSRAGSCSAHRTGAALDIVIGNAPGARVDTATDANRLYLSKTRLYRWLVMNAGRYGFVNYPYEPWHWEWVGEAAYSTRSPQPARRIAR